MANRSLITIACLVAATIAVDAVVISWMVMDSNASSVYAIVAFHAFVLAHVSLVCIWSATGANPSIWKRVAPIPAVLVAVGLTAALINDLGSLRDSLLNHLAYFGTHAALLLAALWVLQRTSYWKQWHGGGQSFRFSIAQLLLLMTLVAVLATLMRHSPMLGDDRWINAAFLSSSVFLAFSAVVVWSLSLHWLIRFAAVLGVALLLGVLFMVGAKLASTEPFVGIVSLVITVHYLIQAVLLSIWLGCLAIQSPRSTPAGATDASSLPQP